MGYDMYIKDPADEKPALPMGEFGKQDWSEYDKWSEKWYFRLNIWGMGEMRQVMYAADILDDSDGSPYPGQESSEDEYQAYLSQKSEDPGKVLTRKFCSNDGWLVTPEECTIIADGLTRLLETTEVRAGVDESPEDVEKWVRDWIGFNRRAAKYGGYQVY